MKEERHENRYALNYILKKKTQTFTLCGYIIIYIKIFVDQVWWDLNEQNTFFIVKR